MGSWLLCHWVFSTSVEVFLVSDHFWAGHTGLLHVRGGVSACGYTPDFMVMSSPRPWRCFLSTPRQPGQIKVFSTSVEVFPITDTVNDVYGSLLHVRGGVSNPTMLDKRLSEVFSTSVEVFLLRVVIRIWK